MQNQDRNGNDVEQHEQHSVSPSILVIDPLSDDYDDKIGKSLADEAHRQIERLDVLGQRADRNPVDAGFGDAADGLQRDVA